MSDTMTAYCPTCRGGVPDPLTEFVDFCSGHLPDAKGADDALVVTRGEFSLYAPSEAEGPSNSAICAVVHRDRAEVE